MDQARENENKMKRFHEQELRMIQTRRLGELIENVLHNYKQDFSLDVVSLILYDKSYELQQILEEEGISRKDMPGLIFSTQAEHLEQLFGPQQPYLGAFQAQQHQWLFTSSPPRETIKSIALLPLRRHGELIGSLNLGSYNSERFTRNSSSDFLQRLSTILAICLENATNHERLKRVGLTDPLTSINNRRFFDQRLVEEIARSTRSQDPIACLLLDVDHFKQINDSHGHQNGDQVLREIARTIRGQLRNSDVIARYGGEEFAILLSNPPPNTAELIAERIRSSIAACEPRLIDQEQSLKVTVSVGVASLDAIHGLEEAGSLGMRLVKVADQAMYQAKSSGRNAVASARIKENEALTEQAIALYGENLM